jgi:two-component system sensor histidine kinase GlrK
MNLKPLLGRLSLVEQWAIATVLSVVPLVIAVGYLGYSLQEQNEQHLRLSQQLELVTRSSKATADRARQLVRVARQYSLLTDASFLERYRLTLDALRDDVGTLRPLLNDTAAQDEMDALISTARDIGVALEAPADERTAVLGRSLDLLVSHSDRLRAKAEIYRRSALDTAATEFRSMVNSLFIVTLLALPSTALLMLIGTLTVSRPLWRLSQTIQALAGQNWATPIEIKGPSDLATLGKNLEWMRQRVVAARGKTTAYVQHVTHELKTPIAAVIEAGNLLGEEVPGPLTATQHAIVDVLISNARTLEHLIQQLLNYNAVSYGIATQWVNIDIYALCQTIRTRLDAAEPDKQPRWAFEGYPREVRSDSRLIEMILKNLLDNAFQFIPPHGRIVVQWGRSDQEWHLSVSDNGAGISQSDLASIYKPFFSGTGGRARKTPRTGVGLSIVSECVNLLKGTIEVTSALGEGTTFSLAFPLITEQGQ